MDEEDLGQDGAGGSGSQVRTPTPSSTSKNMRLQPPSTGQNPGRRSNSSAPGYKVGRGRGRGRCGGRQDKSEVQCDNCRELGYFSWECPEKKQEKEEKALLAGYGSDGPTLL